MSNAAPVVAFVRERAPKVTIGMPIYNGCGPALAAALDGVLRQDYSNCSIFISDNASSDDSLAIVRARCAGDERVTIRPRAATCSADVHFGEVFSLAPPSDYFLFAADDDRYHPSYVSTCIELFERYPAAVSAGSASRLIDTGDATVRVEANIHSAGMSLAQKAREVARRAGWYSFYNLMRRSALAAVGVSSKAFGGDVLLIMRMLCAGDFVATDEPLFSYRMPPVSLTPQEYLDRLDDRMSAGSAPFTGLFATLSTIVEQAQAPPAEREQARDTIVETIVNENGWMRTQIAREHGIMPEDFTLAGCANVLLAAQAAALETV